MRRNGYRLPQRFTQHQIKPEHMKAAIDAVNRSQHKTVIAPPGVALVQQTKLLLKREGSTSKTRELEIANKVLDVIRKNIAMVEVWFEWCKREDVNINSQSAIDAFDRMYQEAVNHPM